MNKYRIFQVFDLCKEVCQCMYEQRKFSESYLYIEWFRVTHYQKRAVLCQILINKRTANN